MVKTVEARKGDCKRDASGMKRWYGNRARDEEKGEKGERRGKYEPVSST